MHQPLRSQRNPRHQLAAPLFAAVLCTGVAHVLAIAPAVAAERPIALREGAGRELVQGICSSCHSLDYVLMNSPFLTLEQWRASVAKMRTTFGAPIPAEDAETIARYLADAYGPSAYAASADGRAAD